MKPLSVAIGHYPQLDKNLETARLKELLKYKDNIYDLHFSHYNREVCSSGRSAIASKDALFQFFEIASNLGFNLTLLLNYILDPDYNKILKNFGEEFYSQGIRSVVIADLELIKRMKQKYPDVHILGSCLSYRMTEDELYEEAKEGVEIHNPAVDIIRDYKQLILNSEAGFKQKVIFGEGCIHKCPHEKVHRYHMATNKLWSSKDDCTAKMKHNYLYFYNANWVTVERLKELMNYIDVVKLPRKNNLINGGFYSSYPPSKTQSLLLYGVSDFFERFYSNSDYNILDYIAVAYYKHLRHTYRKIPASYFDKEFFDTVAYCDMNCEKNNCNLCHRIHKRLVNNYKREDIRI